MRGRDVRHALNSLAVVAPQWLKGQLSPHWVDRYGTRFDDYRLPKGQAERQALAVSIGGDGFSLLEAIYSDQAPAWLREVPGMETLRRVWLQQYYLEEEKVRWRTSQEGLPPAARMINSPYDVEGRYSVKRSTSWTGYKSLP